MRLDAEIRNLILPHFRQTGLLRHIVISHQIDEMVFLSKVINVEHT